MLHRDSDLETNDTEKSWNFELGSWNTVGIKDPERDTLRDLEMDYPNRSNIWMCNLLNEVRLRSIADSLITKVLYL